MADALAVVPGLCSVTFRPLSPREIVDRARRARLEAIEWGGDVHAPPGELDVARKINAITTDAGITVSSYGSYLFAGAGADEPAVVERVLDTTVALGAPNVRVWAKGARAAEELAGVCAAAAERALTVSLEFHPGTCTETSAGTNKLLDEVGAPNLFTYWQPDPKLDVEEQLDALDAVLLRLSHLHVFHWQREGTRLPLADGATLWSSVLDRAHDAGTWTTPRVAFLEFVRDDDPSRLQADAATLNGWLGR